MEAIGGAWNWLWVWHLSWTRPLFRSLRPSGFWNSLVGASTGCMETLAGKLAIQWELRPSNSVLMRCAGVLLLQASAQPYFAEKRGDGEVKWIGHNDSSKAWAAPEIKPHCVASFALCLVPRHFSPVSPLIIIHLLGCDLKGSIVSESIRGWVRVAQWVSELQVPPYHQRIAEDRSKIKHIIRPCWESKPSSCISPSSFISIPFMNWVFTFVSLGNF